MSRRDYKPGYKFRAVSCSMTNHCFRRLQTPVDLYNFITIWIYIWVKRFCIQIASLIIHVKKIYCHLESACHRSKWMSKYDALPRYTMTFIFCARKTNISRLNRSLNLKRYEIASIYVYIFFYILSYKDVENFPFYIRRK